MKVRRVLTPEERPQGMKVMTDGTPEVTAALLVNPRIGPQQTEVWTLGLGPGAPSSSSQVYSLASNGRKETRPDLPRSNGRKEKGAIKGTSI